MFEFIKKIYTNIVRIFLFSIFLWFCGFILYFIVGYFKIPSSEKRTFKNNIDCCEITLDINSKVDNYWNDIIDRKANVNYILAMKIKDNFKYEYYSDNKDNLTINFLDKDGFVLFESSIPIISMTLIADDIKDIKGFVNRGILINNNRYNNERFDFNKYNQVKNIEISHSLYGMKKKEIEIPKDWEIVKPEPKIDESKIIWDKK